MTASDWIAGLFAAIDRRDADRFASYLTEDATFQYGNADPVHGRQAIRRFVAGVFASLQALDHDLLDTWALPGTVICRGRVTYTRHDSSQLTVPFANVLKLEGDLVREYVVYVDASKLHPGA